LPVDTFFTDTRYLWNYAQLLNTRCKNTNLFPRALFALRWNFQILLLLFLVVILVCCFDSARKTWPVENTQILGIFNLCENSEWSKFLGYIPCNNRDVTLKILLWSLVEMPNQRALFKNKFWEETKKKHKFCWFVRYNNFGGTLFIVNQVEQEPGGFKISATLYYQRKSLPKAKLTHLFNTFFFF